MKNNLKISALIAALELCVSANLLYKFSLCPMWMVFLPLVVAVAVCVLAFACKCEKLSAAAMALGNVVLCVTTFFLYRYSTLSILALALPVAFSLTAAVVLMLVKGDYVKTAAIVGTALVALETYLLYQYTLIPLVLVFLPIVVAAALVCHLFIRCQFQKNAGIIAALVPVVATFMLKKGILPTNEVWLQLVAVLAVYAVLVVFARWDSIRESLRKGIVSLKRSPQTIPLVMMFLSFLYYSLNLTDISDTTAKIQLPGMGLCEFCIMLFSLLSLVCMLNAFPRRKKANVPMIVLMYVMFAIIIYCDSHYNSAILSAVNRAENPIPISEYIVAAQNMLVNHRILMVVCAALVALLPVYGKLLKKINTSVEIADNGEMAKLELND